MIHLSRLLLTGDDAKTKALPDADLFNDPDECIAMLSQVISRGKRVDSACSKKPAKDKFAVPKVNSELWDHLFDMAKVRELGLQACKNFLLGAFSTYSPCRY